MSKHKVIIESTSSELNTLLSSHLENSELAEAIDVIPVNMATQNV